MSIKAVLFDFGGVILTSPFDAFERYEERQGLPAGFIRSLNATNHTTNAWAQLESSSVSIDEFCSLFEAEAEAAGADGRLVAADVLACLSGEVRPHMVEAVRRCHSRPGLTTAMLTNNFVADEGARDLSSVFAHFDYIIESSKVGVRKPDVRFYEIALREIGVSASEAVFLDDLGINLKPARALGMTTIKVDDPDVALDELEAVVGFPLRS
ncbi:MAG: putative hydrolase of the superfamily [Actinomycetota bacterium]|jgi:putative hydrolase of the HAD superfamily|nr:putative hydrolase of the superfamily [Actinomycetota bacterium]